jgi:hypothetical protein
LPFRIQIGNVVADKMKNEPAIDRPEEAVRTIEGGDQ